MKFKLDENIPFILKRLIEVKSGNTVDSVHHEYIDGIRDTDLLKRCSDESRILITLDQDFFNITLSPSRPYYGIVLVKSKNSRKKSGE